MINFAKIIDPIREIGYKQIMKFLPKHNWCWWRVISDS